MAIYRHPDGSYRRFPPGAVPAASPVSDPHKDEDGWTQVPGAPAGVEIYRDGKTMRNTAPTPPAK